jgi:mannose-6-phosphate isomerase
MESGTPAMMESGSGLSQALWAPFRIEPNFVPRVWGYHDLRPWFDHIAKSDPVGEVWLTGDQCFAATGPHVGETLGHLFELAPQQLLGLHAPAQGSPLLIKVIFAREKLSVQVHPDDRLARKYGQPRGKTECWYALAADPGARVAVGLKPGMTIDQVRQGIADNTLERSLTSLQIHKGDMVFVDAGTMHAIWPGSVLLEVQQNSDITYRLYDYGRPRELHIEKGLEAIRLETQAGKVAPEALADRSVLIDVDYFRMERIPVRGKISSDELRGPMSPGIPAGLSYLFASGGSGKIGGPGFDAFDLPGRSLACIPAAAPLFSVEDLGGLELIRITPKWPA